MKQSRQCNAAYVVKRLKTSYNDELIRDVNRTGEMFPRGSLQKLVMRRFFAFVHDSRCAGRFFTARLCRLVVRKLYSELLLSPARDPSVSLQTWLSKQGQRLQYLCMRMKRSTYVFPEEPSSCEVHAMDSGLETQLVPSEELDAIAAPGLALFLETHTHCASFSCTDILQSIAGLA